MDRIFSPGKLLLTSEYFILDGALGLALPTKLGQEFFYSEKVNTSKKIIWEAKQMNEAWLKIEIDYSDWSIIKTNNEESALFIIKVLKEVQQLSDVKFHSTTSYHICTNLQFPSNFGLGSSSTLMNNLANWAKINPFELNERCLGGSGYDIAVAQQATSILYQRTPTRLIEPISFNPTFKEELIFIHLNQKQNSREGIKHYRTLKKDPSKIKTLTQLTQKVVNTSSLKEFSELMIAHENQIAEALNLQKVKDIYFADYGGFVKSLGAWGGDFVIASKFGDYKSYFKHKNFNTIYEFSDLII